MLTAAERAAAAQKRREERAAERRIDRQIARDVGLPVEPVINKVIDKAIDKAVDAVAASPTVPAVTQANAPVIADVIKEVLDANPQFKNATGTEPVMQSGVMYGAVTGIIAGVMGIWGLIYNKNYNPELLAPPILSIIGGAFTLYRRFMPGLKPLFSK